MDGRTYGLTDIFPPLILLGRLLEVDLKRKNANSGNGSSSGGGSGSNSSSSSIENV